MLEQLKEQWDNILLHVKEEHDIMDVSFNTWLLPLKIFAVDGNVVKILAPDAQMLRYIQKKYGLILQVSSKKSPVLPVPLISSPRMTSRKKKNQRKC